MDVRTYAVRELGGRGGVAVVVAMGRDRFPQVRVDSNITNIALWVNPRRKLDTGDELNIKPTRGVPRDTPCYSLPKGTRPDN